MKQPPELTTEEMMAVLSEAHFRTQFCPRCSAVLTFMNTIVIQMLVYEDVWTRWIPWLESVSCEDCYDKYVRPILVSAREQTGVTLGAFRVLDSRGQWGSVPHLPGVQAPKSDPSVESN